MKRLLSFFLSLSLLFILPTAAFAVSPVTKITTVTNEFEAMLALDQMTDGELVAHLPLDTPSHKFKELNPIIRKLLQIAQGQLYQANVEHTPPLTIIQALLAALPVNLSGLEFPLLRQQTF